MLISNALISLSGYYK